MHRALLALGSNQGDRATHVADAVARLGEHPGVRVIAVSEFLRTMPAGGPSGQGEFLNAAAIVETRLEPLELLDWTQEVERRGGRVRREVWGERTIDIDLLLVDDRVCRLPRLELPHPRLAYRRFMLEPARALAPSWVHPRIGWTLERLTRFVMESPLYLAVVGGTADDRESLVRRVLERRSGQWLHADAAEDGERVRAVLAEAARAPRDALRVSDFWWDVWPDAARSASDSPLEPVLVVLLDVDPGMATDADRELARRVEAPGRGPWLRLDQAACQRQVDELVGAIDALRG